MDTFIIASQPGIDNHRGRESEVPDDLTRFLGALFEPGDIICIRPIETWTDPVTQQKKRRVLYEEIDYGSVHWLLTHARYWDGLLALAESEKANLFFSVCPRYGPYNLYEQIGVRLRWDHAWQIRSVRVLWADLDHCTVEEALSRCESAELPCPSVVVRSGHGCHLYWILDTPYLIDDAGEPPGVGTGFVSQKPGEKRLPRKYAQTYSGTIDLYLPDPQTGGDSSTPNPEFSRKLTPKALHIQDVLSGIAAVIGGDHTSDLSRLLRLPGTLNRKDERNGNPPVPCELVECDASKRYPLEVFARFVPAAPSKVRREQVAQIKLPAGQNLTSSLSRRLSGLINACLTAADRSRADWALACWCVEKGLDKEVIWQQVKEVGKFAERKRDYFDLTWKNAEEHTRAMLWQRSAGPDHGVVGAGSRGSGSSGLGCDNDGPLGDNSDSVGDRPPVRSTILITTDEYRTNDEAIAALSDPSTAPEVFQRGNMLVTVLQDSMNSRIMTRPPGTPRIAPLPAASLRELLTRVAQFARRKDGELLPAHPPEWCVPAVAARGNWPDIRSLEGVIETPSLRPDGSMLDTPGWDARTGLLYMPNADYLRVPETPSQADAQTAAAILLDLVSDFPFVSPAHSAVWLAGVLTALARFAVLGPCPLFLFEGNSPGTGKSLLADLIALIATGRLMSRTAYPDSDEEMRKRITAVALAGDRLMLLDNIATAFGGSSLDAALTATTWRDRLLGRSEMTTELPLQTVWYATGNNITLRGDGLRRVLLSRLETRDERPEERTGFRHPDLVEHVRKQRPLLVCAALTLLRAYIVAGRPGQNLPTFGSFEAWSRTIRSAVYWATENDPCATREGLRAIDPRLNNLASVLAGWGELPGGRTGVTIADALSLLSNYNNQNQFTMLRGALKEWSRNDNLPSAGIIGAKFRSLRGQILNGMALRASTGHGGAQRWRVDHIDE